MKTKKDTLHNRTTGEVYLRANASGLVLDSVLVTLESEFETAMDISDGAGSPVWNESELSDWIECAKIEIAEAAAPKQATTAAAMKAARAIQAQVGITGITEAVASVIEQETDLPALIAQRHTLLELVDELLAFANGNNRINLTGHLARAVEIAREAKGGAR